MRDRNTDLDAQSDLISSQFAAHPPMSSSPKTRPRELDDHASEEPTAKRTKLDGAENADPDVPMDGSRDVVVVDVAELEDQDAMDTDAPNQASESMQIGRAHV